MNSGYTAPMPASVRTPDEAPPLIFQWKRERGVKRRLAMWILVVAAGHAALFYLFRVSPPLATRKPPPQQSVLYLPPGEPGVQELFSRLDDRYPGAVLRPEDYTLAADTAALSRAVPRVQPSWESRGATPKPFPQPVVPGELPALYQSGDPVLPSLDSGAPAVSAAPPGVATAKAPSVILESGNSSRTVTSLPHWPAKLMDDWPASGSVPFMLAVNSRGLPEYCLPMAQATGSNIDPENIRRALMTMRFTAAAGPVEWVTVSVRW